MAEDSLAPTDLGQSPLVDAGHGRGRTPTLEAAQPPPENSAVIWAKSK
jgi:hypothetical protein